VTVSPVIGPEVPRRSESPREQVRLAVSVTLAAAGAALAAYLAAAELGLVHRVWDPIFGSASAQRVLHSRLSQALPVPDAALGAAGYVVELALAAALLASARRLIARPWLGLAYGGLATLMAVAGLALVAVQAFIVGAFCSLCLASALLSCALALVAIPTAVASARAVLGRA
jgi:uncharacterized membrane protein